MTSVQTYHRPASVEDAWRLLSENGKAARLVGGGIDVALFTPPEITMLIDLTTLNQRAVELRNGELVMGAVATLTQVLESPAASEYMGGIVSQVMKQVASPLLRNAATLGGTLASTHPWSDVIPLFLVLDASVTEYAGSYETKTLEKLVAQRGSIGRAIITDVRLPAMTGATHASFESFVRTEFDVGMLNCACRLTLELGTCRDVRIAFGGTPDIGQRMPGIEQALEGQPLSAEVIEAVAVQAAEAIPARDDLRASASYRGVLAKAGIRRCLNRIANRGGE